MQSGNVEQRVLIPDLHSNSNSINDELRNVLRNMRKAKKTKQKSARRPVKSIQSSWCEVCLLVDYNAHMDFQIILHYA